MKGNILIVDDEPDICWALEHIMESMGLACHKALTAQKALDLMKAYRFRMAFLDVTLPDMQGLELARRLRNLDHGLRIVIVTGYMPVEEDPLTIESDEELFCACIYKPFIHKAIADAVKIANINDSQEDDMVSHFNP
jgi:DNA-binding NtrC family response regulator